jgi:hypothetical protein
MPLVLMPMWWVGLTASSGEVVTSAWLERVGVAAIAIVIMGMWQRDTAKSRDRAVAGLEAAQPVLQENIFVLKEGVESTKEMIDATKSLVNALQHIPDADECYRLRRALEDAQRKMGE